MEISVEVSQKAKKIEFLYDIAIPHPEGFMYYYRDTCSSILIVGLFTTARKWNQPRCEWIKNIHIHTGKFPQL